MTILDTKCKIRYHIINNLLKGTALIQLQNTNIFKKELEPYDYSTEKGIDEIFVGNIFVGKLVATGHAMCPLDFEDYSLESITVLLEELCRHKEEIKELSLEILINEDNSIIDVQNLDSIIYVKNGLVEKDSLDSEVLAIIISECFAFEEVFNDKTNERINENTN